MVKFLILVSVSFFNPEVRIDSIGVETINGKVFVVHKVDAGETLYAISKRYGATVDQILEFNSTADAGLEIGQILKVPYVPRVKRKASNGNIHVVAEKETLFSISRLYGVSVDEIKQWNGLSDDALSLGQELTIKKKAAIPTANPVEVKSAKGVHTVAAKETLYSITRQYGISVQQLKDWNNLQNDELKIGQVLYVTQPMYSQSTATVNPATQNQPPVVQTQPVVAVVAPVVAPVAETPAPTIKISENVRGSDEIIESGLAELIEGTEGNRKYLALHRTAPTGTILKIRNEMNGREVFVRVMGPLPNTALTDKIIIRISKSAYDRLGAIDQRFRVEVTYYK
ncbi:MAG: LysM peptidoglycan-binding domain-containing protein [Cyclobacteriaceae bacterium]